MTGKVLKDGPYYVFQVSGFLAGEEKGCICEYRAIPCGLRHIRRPERMLAYIQAYTGMLLPALLKAEIRDEYGEAAVIPEDVKRYFCRELCADIGLGSIKQLKKAWNI